MPILIRTDEKQSFWIDVDGSLFHVRPLTSSEDTELSKKHTKYKNGMPQRDISAIQKSKFRRMVLTWEGVEDIHGNEVSYSDSMKANFAELNPDLAFRIIRQAEMHDVATAQEEFDNLGKSQSGDDQEH